MAVNTLQQVYDQVRGYLHDTQLVGGEIFTNSALQTHFNEAYRRMVNCMMGLSKRIQRSVYVNLPASTTVLIPAGYGITDFSEPELLEERPAVSAVAIQSTTATTPVTVNSTSHGFGTAGQIVELTISGVSNSFAAWGQWYATIVDANSYTLNGSVTDGVAGGSGGFASPTSTQAFTPMQSADLPGQCVDGQASQTLGCYVWANEQLQFRGALNPIQLRITYWASGTPPTNTTLNIGIDNCIDFLACATAANAARAQGWNDMADQLKSTAFGPTQQGSDIGGLLGEFLSSQVKFMQRGPQRRRRPFRDHTSKFGNSVVQ